MFTSGSLPISPSTYFTVGNKTKISKSMCAFTGSVQQRKLLDLDWSKKINVSI